MDLRTDEWRVSLQMCDEFEDGPGSSIIVDLGMRFLPWFWLVYRWVKFSSA